MTIPRQWLFVSWLLLLLSCCDSIVEYVFCKGGLSIRRDDEGVRYVFTRYINHNMIIPPEDFPEEITHESFLIMLEKVLQHNFALRQDEELAAYGESTAAPFIYTEFIEFLRLKKVQCFNGRLTDTEQSQLTRMALSKLYVDVKGMQGLTNWVHPLKSHCSWKGITCDQDGKLQELRLTHMNLKGTLPSELGLIAPFPVLDLSGNKFRGSIPAALFSNIQHLDLSGNQFTSVSWEIDQISTYSLTDPVIEYLDVSVNHLSTTLPTHWNPQLANLRVLDLSRNALTGTIAFPEQLSSLEMLFLGANLFTGNTPALTGSLRLFDVGQNLLTGTIPSSLPASLEALILADNELEGEKTLDLFVSLSNLEVLQLQNNQNLRGSIPAASQWSKLGTFSIRNNAFTGPIPPQFLQTVQHTLQFFDVAFNSLSGIISPDIGLLKRMRTIDAASNRLRGTLPNEMLGLEPNLRLNFSDNNLIGTVPPLFCGHGTANMLYREFGCDAVLCRAGTFNPHGHATLYSACRPCPDGNLIIGRTSCETVDFVHGDLNADGILSAREVLRVIFIDLMGRFWGKTFQPWADMSIHECSLVGITCNNDGQVIKIDLSAATICSDGDGRPGPIPFCKGLPGVIGTLSHLEEFSAKSSPFLRGTIPPEFGNLHKMQTLDLSGPNSISGTIPTELGDLTMLQFLNLSSTRLRGRMPTELYGISTLMKLLLSNNILTGTIPSSLGNLSNLQTLVVSRNRLRGSIPSEISGAINLENFEGYANSLSGSIPSEIGMCTKLKRLDLFSNKLEGTLPSELGNLSWLQIIHLRKNKLTGTIPPSLGNLEYLSWFDVSENVLHGTIHPSFAEIRVLRDFRLSGNRIYDPIPPELCQNANVNGGAARRFGCDAILCPLGTFAEDGLATNDVGCTPCPEGETTMYLGAHNCIQLSEKDILSIFFEVMNGDEWPDEAKLNWGDHSVDLCDWGGITCNENGEVESLSFPSIGGAVPAS